MELRHLRYFTAVAEDENFTRAAGRLHIAQPALSVQIRQLEAEVGAELLARQGRGVKLTAAGRVFLEYARRTLADANRAVALARQAANGETGNLGIGHNTPAEFQVFPQVVPSFKRQSPNVHLTFQSLRTPSLLEKLRRDELDIGFSWLPVPTEEFDVQELMQVPLVAVIPAEHPLASATSVSISALSCEPLILFSRVLDPESSHQIQELFHTAGSVMNVVYEFELMMSVMNFVAMGCGCSLLPNYANRIRLDGVVFRSMPEPTVVKTLAIVKKKRSSKIADIFFQFTIDRLRATADAA